MKKGILSIVFLIVVVSANCFSQNTSRPNVLFISVDDLNDWIGCLNGHPDVKTPNIDRLAKQGTLFANAHCTAPICAPSRASVMTGLRPSTTGVYGQINDNDLRDVNSKFNKSIYLSEYFQLHGYKTMGIGKIFHGSDGNGAFEEYGGIFEKFGPRPAKEVNWESPNTNTDWGAFPDSDNQMPDTKFAKWAVEKLNQVHDKPFFMAVGFIRPHVPWHVPQKWYDMYEPDMLIKPPFLPNDLNDVPEISKKIEEMPMMPTTEWAKKTGQWKNIIQAYLASVTFVDDKIGLVLDALKKSDYAENTIVVLWSDHGYHLGEKNRFAKHSLWERSTKVPLIIAGPGLPVNQNCSKPVSLIDVYPTLVELCSLPVNKKNEGNSLAPLVKKTNKKWDHVAITTYGRNNHAIRTEHFRYIHYEDGSEELYDHRNDPNEWYNVSGKAEYQKVITDLKKHLPKLNALWVPKSYNSANRYFRVEQNADKERK